MKKKSQQFIERNQANNSESNGNVVKQVKDTPFTIVKLKNEVIIAIGSDAIKSGFETMAEAEEYIEQKPWELIFNGVTVYVDYVNKIKKEMKHETKNE